MEPKVSAYLAALLAIVLLGGGFMRMTAIDEVRGKISDVQASIRTAKTAIENIKENIERKRKSTDEISGTAAADVELASRPVELAKALEEAKKNTEQRSREAISYEQDLAQAALSVRAAAIGTTLPSLTLNNGKVLEGVVIKRISEDTVTVTHSVGSARLQKADLPAELVMKFQIDDPLPPPPPLKGSNGKVIAAPKGPSVPPDRAKLAETKARLAALKAQIHIAEGTVKLWQERLSDAESKRANSGGGKIVGAGPYSVDTAKKSYESAQQQLTQLEAQLIAAQEMLRDINSGG